MRGSQSPPCEKEWRGNSVGSRLHPVPGQHPPLTSFAHIPKDPQSDPLETLAELVPTVVFRPETPVAVVWGGEDEFGWSGLEEFLSEIGMLGEFHVHYLVHLRDPVSYMDEGYRKWNSPRQSASPSSRDERV